MKNKLIALGLLVCSSVAQATIYDFTFSSGDQELLTGHVDTHKDALFVTGMTSWSPGNGYIVNPVIPDFAVGSFPDNQWKLGAVQLDGSSYDIADNWDGIIGGSWGFASDVDAENVSYLGVQAPVNPFFKFFMSIGIMKTYFPMVDFLSYEGYSQSTLLPDGSFHSGLHNFFAYDSTAFPPLTMDDFSQSVSLLSSGGTYRVSQRAEVPESGSLVMLLIGLIALVVGRVATRK
ncbi:MAG TPA: hypothetical protein VLF09_11845 [Cellvibrio sp.]|nr:hypothetical protein [Cellvibrio sp.]